MSDRLYRSRDERVIAGVAGGLADRLDLDPSVVRIVWVLLMVLSGGLFLLIYVVMALVVPEAPEGYQPAAATAGPPGSGAVPGWVAASDSGAGRSPASGTPVGPESTPAAGGPDAASQPGSTASSAGDQSGAGSSAQWIPPDRRTRRRDRDGLGGLIAGLILVVLGAYFLVQMFVPEIDLGAFWPVILLIIGLALIVGSIRRTPHSGAG